MLTAVAEVSCGFDASGVALAAGKLATSFYKVQDRCKNPETAAQIVSSASFVIPQFFKISCMF